jgi:hypothetical protein
MIIVLKNANFSASNIGTLSSWRIIRSLGTGATYDGPVSVDKGAAFNATITIAEGYELAAAGITITMNGVVVENAVSPDAGNFIITIHEVTGNVLIKVPTVNTATGEEEEPEVPDTPDQPGTGGNDENLLTLSPVWEQGTLIAATGEQDNSTRIRTEFIDIAHLENLTTNFDVNTYAISVFWYSLLGDTKPVNVSNWSSENLNINANNKSSNYIRILVKRLDETNISIDEANNINVNIILNADNTENITTTWIQGAISGTFSETSDATRIKTEYIPATNLLNLTTDFNSSIYNVAVYWYSEPKLAALKNTPTYQAENLNITAVNKEGNYLRLVVKRSDNASILPSESEAINLEIKSYQDGGN